MSKFVSFSCEMETLQQHMHGWVCEIPLIPLYLFIIPPLSYILTAGSELILILLLFTAYSCFVVDTDHVLPDELVSTRKCLKRRN